MLLESVGQEAYWLMDNDEHACFVTQQQYWKAVIGQPFDCLWRERQP
jgi:hypothetical protein